MYSLFHVIDLSLVAGYENIVMDEILFMLMYNSCVVEFCLLRPKL